MINFLRLNDIRSKRLRIFLISVMLILIVAGAILFHLYTRIFSSNVDLNGEDTAYLYVSSTATQADVIDLLEQEDWIKNANSLEWVMDKKNFANHIHGGRYQIKNGMSNNDLVNLLRSGVQSPIQLTFNNTRTLEDFAGKIAKQIEADSLSLITALRDENRISKYGFKPETVIGMFIPNTYQLYWNTTTNAFMDRMYKEYSRFWNAERLKKAEKIGLSPVEVSILASIVDEETIKNDEKNRVAGVYMNRLNRKIKLDADPTLKFALGDFTIKRVLNKHKRIDSPYNTYKYRGLPPGPIRQASISGLNAVLNYENHKYYYFCANPDFSGYHIFARTLREHNRNARKYQNELNRRRIMK
ncbi:endolytic transglycosylase MltG [Marinifilum caeruleilacunae]|uniref:Endolytic murein transglycosylase n=1 Tax=Marinifilum caeruleilacunae TaxID=2499076 RepID=A0ABX1WXQ1_9BACT|nr:endolytic transglycosylase MltG [Marinifilum caeruleilacunae]NOU60918.1 endolytic transglycosylase MltG [Marinifilum caeruleilacunae]